MQNLWRFFCRIFKVRSSSVQCVLAACVLCCCVGCDDGEPNPATAKVDTVAVVTQGVRECARLATAQFTVYKVVTFDDRVVVSGRLFSHAFSQELPAGDRKIALPVSVTLRGYVDFSSFSSRSVKRSGDKIVIVLPDPQVEVENVHIDRSRMLEYVAPWRSRFKESEIDAMARQAVDSIMVALPELGIVENCRRSAVDVIIPVTERMGYSKENVTVSFRPEVSDRTVRRFLDVEQWQGIDITTGK